MGRKDRLTASGDPWLESVTLATPAMGRISGRGETEGASAIADVASTRLTASVEKKAWRMLLLDGRIVVLFGTI
jgi:hypothetical protein